MTTAQDSGKVVSLMHRPPLTPGVTLGTNLMTFINSVKTLKYEMRSHLSQIINDVYKLCEYF